jgi:hypothetical protein
LQEVAQAIISFLNDTSESEMVLARRKPVAASGMPYISEVLQTNMEKGRIGGCGNGMISPVPDGDQAACYNCSEPRIFIGFASSTLPKKKKSHLYVYTVK